MNDFLKLALSLSLAAGSLIAQDGAWRADEAGRPDREDPASQQPLEKLDGEDAKQRPDGERPERPEPTEELIFDVRSDGDMVHFVERAPKSIALIVFGAGLLEAPVEIAGGLLAVKPDIVLPLSADFFGQASVAIPVEVYYQLRKEPLFLQAIGLRDGGIVTGKVMEL